METEKLSISLPKDMAQRIRRTVADGSYSSNSEVIREAMRLWEQREQERVDRLAAIRAGINEAAESTDRLTDADVARHFQARQASKVSKKAS